MERSGSRWHPVSLCAPFFLSFFLSNCPSVFLSVCPPPLTGQVDVLLAGQPDPGVELPHHVLVLAGLPDVLHQAGVVEVGAVEADAERLSSGDRPGAERLHRLARALAPVAGGESRHGQKQGQEVQGESQRRSPPPVDPHHGPDPAGF